MVAFRIGILWVALSSVAVAQGGGSLSPVSGARSCSSESWPAIEGMRSGEFFGLRVVNLGDINLDNLDDIAVAAPGYDGVNPSVIAGKVYVYSGCDGSLIREHAGMGVESFGLAIAAADVDGDGAKDLVIGNPDRTVSATTTGQVTVYSGRTGALLLSIDNPYALTSWFGVALCGAGDIDGDGRDEIAIAGPNFSSPSQAALYSGLDGQPLWAWTQGTGITSLTSTGDLDGDGILDIAVGDAHHNSYAGRVVALSGSNGQQIWEASGSSFFGFSLSPASKDISGDDIRDILVGEPFFGGDSGRISLLSGANGTTLWSRIDDADYSTQFGISVAGPSEIFSSNPGLEVVGVSKNSAWPYGELKVFDAATGNLLAHYDKPAGGYDFGGLIGGALVTAKLRHGSPRDMVVGHSSWDLGTAGENGGQIRVYTGH